MAMAEIFGIDLTSEYQHDAMAIDFVLLLDILGPRVVFELFVEILVNFCIKKNVLKLTSVNSNYDDFGASY